MTADRPHFTLGHFCGSCPMGRRLHIGCVSGGDVFVSEDDPGRTSSKKGKVINPVNSFNRVVYKNRGEEIEPLETYTGILLDSSNGTSSESEV